VLLHLKGGAKARMTFLTQVYTGAGMSDMFPNYVSINPANDHAPYPWDSDLFAPIDKDRDPIMVVPPAPAGGGVPPGLHLLSPEWLFPLAAALAAAGGAPAAAPAAAPWRSSCNRYHSTHDQLTAAI
jgi:hypothetical protein